MNDSFAEEARKRREYAERKVQERHNALRAEALERHRHSLDHSQKVKEQLKREQEQLSRQMQKLNEDEERRAKVMAENNKKTSRLENFKHATTNSKKFAFGSSTPRELSYLNNLPKSEKAYDKRLSPISGPPPPPKPASAQRGRTPLGNNSMTSSLYVTASATSSRPKPRVLQPKKEVQLGSSMMTQSVYNTPTKPRTAPFRPLRTSTNPASPAPGTPAERTVPPRPRTSSQFSAASSTARNSNRQSPAKTPPKPSTAAPKPRLPLAARASPAKKAEIRKSPSPPTTVPTPTPPPVPAVPVVVEPTVTIEENVTEVVAEPVSVVENQAAPTPEPNVDVVVDVPTEPVKETAHVVEQETAAVGDLVQELVYRVDQDHAVESAPEDPLVVVSTPAAPVEAAVEVEEEKTDSVEPEVTHEVEVKEPEQQNQEIETPSVDEHKEDSAIEQNQQEKQKEGNDLVALLGNDKIENLIDPQQTVQPEQLIARVDNLVLDDRHHHHHDESQDDADSGKASPTSSERSDDDLTHRESTPVTVREEPVLPRRISPQQSEADLERKRQEEKAALERKARIEELLAKTRGMPRPDSLTSVQTAAVISEKTNEDEKSMEVTPTLPPAEHQPVESDVPPTDSSRDDILARVAKKSNLASLQKLLERKKVNGHQPTAEPAV